MGDDKMTVTEYLDHGDLACRALRHAIELCERPDVQRGDIGAVISTLDIALVHLRAMEAARVRRIQGRDSSRDPRRI